MINGKLKNKLTFLLLALSFSVFCQNATLLNQNINIDLSKNKLTKKFHYEIQINNHKGDEFSTITIPFHKYEKITDIKASLTDVLGNEIVKLKPKDILKKSYDSDGAFFVDIMMYEFTLQHYQYPYKIKYSYTEESNEFLNIHSWYPIIDPHIETEKAELTLTTDLAYKLKYEAAFINNPVVDTVENRVTYKWNSAFVPLAQPEVFMLSIEHLIPRLIIVPEKFKYQTSGSFFSWKTYGDWQFNINSKLQNLSNHEKAFIANAIKNIPDTLQRIKTLYHRLQDETRYVNVMLNKGGLIPTDALLVCENKYGDCKGLTNYFRAVLNSVGIESNYTDIHAGDKISPISTNFPSQQFNHVILSIPYKNDTIWLDCTSKGPFGYVGTFIQNRPAFVIDKENSHITKTPSLTIDNVATDRNFHISIDAVNGNCIKANCTYRGDEFETLLYYNKQPKAKQLELILNNMGIRNAEIATHTIKHQHRDSTKINLEYTAFSTKYIQKSGNDMFLKPVPFDLPLIQKPAQRNFPLSIDYPISVSDSQFFEVSNIKATTNPFPDIHINTKFGSYSKSIAIHESGIKVSKQLIINTGFYDKSDYAEFYSFFEQIKENESNTLIVRNNL